MPTNPGKDFRNGISLTELIALFPDDDAAERWLIEQRWQGQITCPNVICKSTNIQTGAAHPTMPMRCRTCRRRFSVKTGTPMEASNLGYQVWVIAIFLMSVSLKGVSSMRLYRDLKITQRAAWHLAHRIREAWGIPFEKDPFHGPLEADETSLGGLAKNMHGKRRRKMAEEGWPNKTKIVGIRDRKTGHIRAKVVTQQAEDEDFIPDYVARAGAPDAVLYTDEGSAYRRLKKLHETVTHGAKEYVRGDVHINSLESFWSLLKRGYVGTFHKMSPEHVHRYLAEFVGRNNVRRLDTIDQMGAIVRGMEGRRLKWKDLTRHRHGRRARAI